MSGAFDLCEQCGRSKAHNWRDVCEGSCPKYWAFSDSEAQDDCERHAIRRKNSLESITAEQKELADQIGSFLWESSKLRHGLFTPPEFNRLVKDRIKQFFFQKNKTKDDVEKPYVWRTGFHERPNLHACKTPTNSHAICGMPMLTSATHTRPPQTECCKTCWNLVHPNNDQG